VSARLRDVDRPFSRRASLAKLVATGNAMKVTTDAVQVLGGAGYTRDFPLKRYMRETTVMLMFEGRQPDRAPGHQPRPRALTRPIHNS